MSNASRLLQQPASSALLTGPGKPARQSRPQRARRRQHRGGKHLGDRSTVPTCRLARLGKDGRHAGDVLSGGGGCDLKGVELAAPGEESRFNPQNCG